MAAPSEGPASASEGKRVVVIGGGASGLMAACAAASSNNSVILLEKNEKLGKKIYITGKGRCNLTNSCDAEEFLQNVVHGGKFLRGAIYRFPPAELMRWMEENGLPLKVERGNRVFPVSDHASDVTKTLERACRASGVDIRLGCEVLGVESEGGNVTGVRTAEGVIPSDVVIVATGGVSYPSTGSTGDGYRFASGKGHTVSRLFPSLVGINLAENVEPFQGISLKNVVLTAKRLDQVIFSGLGEMLFTHYGVSGPLVLSLSALICRMDIKQIGLIIDFKPALDEKKLDSRLVREFGERGNEQMKTIMRSLLPAALCSEVLARAKLLPQQRGNCITREERGRLGYVLKHFALTPKSLRGFDEAVVTSGGISLNEIDPATMESRLCHGLRFCGETLDVDAFTGGFNLQIAFSTGYIAGKTIK